MNNKHRIGDALAELWRVAMFLIVVAIMIAAPSVGAFLRDVLR